MKAEKRFFVSMSLLFCLAMCTNVYSAYPFEDPNLLIEERVNNIVSLMTLEGKISCLSTDPNVPRLDIKGSRHIEGLHGVALGGPASSDNL
jgi:hypothetical protein